MIVAAAAVAGLLAPLHTPAHDPVYVPPPVFQALGECESLWTPDVDTGNGYYGLYQFSLRSWRWVGGDEFAAMPSGATVREQTVAASRLVDRQGWRRAFPACSRKLGLGEPS